MTRSWFVRAAVCGVVGFAAGAGGAVVMPAGRGIELPAGATELKAEDPQIAAILQGAASTAGGKITNDAAGKTFLPGKTPVTWTDDADGKTLSACLYVYPHGWQVLGASDDLRTFEPNGARHILHDKSGRVHVIYSDSRHVWYRLGEPKTDRVKWQAPVRVSDDPVQPDDGRRTAVRGQTFALVEGKDGKVDVQCVWSGSGPGAWLLYARRLTVDARGKVTASDPIDTRLTGAPASQGATSQQDRRRGHGQPPYSLPALAADSGGRLHMVAHFQSTLLYAFSEDGRRWVRQKVWDTADTGSRMYRYPSIAVDSHDRVHAIWQTMGFGGKWQWWAGLYTVRDRNGEWTAPVNVLADLPQWQMPRQRGREILFAYPNMVIDDRDNVHIAWHGTAGSGKFGLDDTFYLVRPRKAGDDGWNPWTGYAVLHQRDHAGDGNGQDGDFSWVPSLAYHPKSDDIYAMIMFGPKDDEVPDAGVNTTDGALKVRHAGKWGGAFENLTRTRDLRSWYPNVAPDIWMDKDGRSWLDLIWLDGTLDDYNVVFRRVEVSREDDGETTAMRTAKDAKIPK